MGLALWVHELPLFSEAWCSCLAPEGAFKWPCAWICYLFGDRIKAPDYCPIRLQLIGKKVAPKHISTRRVTQRREQSTWVGETHHGSLHRTGDTSAEACRESSSNLPTACWDWLCSGDAELSLPRAWTPLLLPAPHCVGEEPEAQKASVSYPRPHCNEWQSQNSVQA